MTNYDRKTSLPDYIKKSLDDGFTITQGLPVHQA
jgi:hypothetical protein